MHIWQIHYDYVIYPGEGPGGDAFAHNGNIHCVLTIGDAISDVVKAVELQIGSGCAVTHVSKCIFLGRSMNTLALAKDDPQINRR